MTQVIADNTNYQAFTEDTPMPYNVSDMTATMLSDSIFNDNRVYLLGGCISDQDCSGAFCVCTEYTDKCIYFLPANKTWHNCASMPIPRYRHMATQVGSDIYVIGGRNVTTDAILDSIDKYDPVANTWTTVFTSNSLITSDAVAFTVGTNIYQVGGYDSGYTPLATVVIFDTVAKTASNGPSAAVGRGDTQIVYYEGEHYVLGGFGTDFCKPLKTVESYSETSGEWTTCTDLIYGRGDMAAAVMGGYVFAIAGETKDSACANSVPVSSVTRYNAGTWAIEQELTDSNFRFVAVSYDNTVTGDFAIFLFGGQGEYDSVNKKFPILDTTVRYVPYSVRNKNDTLSAGGIAGVVIAGIVVGAFIVFIILSYVAYQKRDYFLMSDDSMDPKNKNNSSFDAAGSTKPSHSGLYGHSTATAV